ncbi:hypothetical protein GCM10027449_14950 [Sinomonas notoginsengisoli]|uniref:hypothetical protein n=1 Tax=Sinomonas notoginsengisoli TaxID=1457311 RepID=UPI001F16A04F|nr:hypothetical protein [Sinomonas notoginsengisoli]
MSEDADRLVEEVEETSVEETAIVLDVDAIPDGSGNDRDPDTADAERFDAG